VDESQQWGRSRYLALLVVSTLHAALLVGLLIPTNTRLLSIRAPGPIELLVLPPEAASLKTPPPPALPTRRKKIEASTSAVPPSPALTIAPLAAAADNSGPPVDWAKEAQNVTTDIARDDSAQHRQRSDAVPSSKSVFGPPPAHHAGEQYATADGKWIVYVTDNCYQISNSISTAPNGINNGMGLQTYCNGRSRKPRGDLFDQLPAYKLHRPDH
jgi:hypothetical protein